MSKSLLACLVVALAIIVGGCEETKQEELLRQYHAYVRADDIDKPAIAGAVRASFADYDTTLIPSLELRSWLREMLKEGGAG